MAKRKKHHKKTHSRRKRHSSMGAIDTMNILGIVIGAVAAGYLDKIIPDTINSKIVAGGKIALGIALPMFVKGGKMKNTLAGVGSGMVAVGTLGLLKEFGVLSGMDDSDYLEVTLNGDQDILAGDDLSVVNGGESILAEDDLSVVNGYYDEDSY